jgi:anti-anti-sigma factor
VAGSPGYDLPLELMLEDPLSYSGLAKASGAFAIDIIPDRERAVIAPRGELDLATIGQLAAAVDALVADGWAALVLDLRGLSFIDSIGLSFAIRQSARRDVRVQLVDGTGAVSQLFDTAGVRELLPFIEPRPAWRRS